MGNPFAYINTQKWTLCALVDFPEMGCKYRRRVKNHTAEINTEKWALCTP